MDMIDQCIDKMLTHMPLTEDETHLVRANQRFFARQLAQRSAQEQAAKWAPYAVVIDYEHPETLDLGEGLQTYYLVDYVPSQVRNDEA